MMKSRLFQETKEQASRLENISKAPSLRIGDFSYFCQVVPGCYGAALYV